jgi:hypothetical protein
MVERINNKHWGIEILPRTLCFPLSSFDSADDIIFLRIEEGAAKCALRDLRREEETSRKEENRGKSRKQKLGQKS